MSNCSLLVGKIVFLFKSVSNLHLTLASPQGSRKALNIFNKDFISSKWKTSVMPVKLPSLQKASCEAFKVERTGPLLVRPEDLFGRVMDDALIRTSSSELCVFGIFPVL